LQLFCKNGGPVAQPFPPCFPYQPPRSVRIRCSGN